MPRYFVERGKTHEDVLDRLRSKYGDRARILFQKTVPGQGLLGLFGREVVEYTGYVAAGNEVREADKTRDEKNKAAILAASPAASGNPSKLDSVLEELRDLKTHLSVGASLPPPQPFPVLTELEQILEDNDCSDEYIAEMTGVLRRELSGEDLDDREKVHQAAVLWMAGSINFWRNPPLRGPRIFILVGPTGVGKTTTIAKLAAVNGLAGGGQSPPMDVRIFTVDSFRIGAKAQLETYGEIMGIPVVTIDDEKDLRKQVALASEADLILVDTIGKSPRDFMKIAEMRDLLSACGESSEVHLALSATTKTEDLQEIVRQFEPFSFRSIVLTKLDETSKVGNLMSFLWTMGRPLSYLTNGQSVPVDIAQASPSALMERLKGLDYDAEILKDLHPAVDLTAAWR